LPLEHVYHEDEYEQDMEKFKSQLADYDEFISNYYETRTNGQRKDRWTEQIANMLSKQTRMYMKEFIQNNKLDLH